jgi:hypothetical protein
VPDAYTGLFRAANQEVDRLATRCWRSIARTGRFKAVIADRSLWAGARQGSCRLFLSADHGMDRSVPQGTRVRRSGVARAPLDLRLTHFNSSARSKSRSVVAAFTSNCNDSAAGLFIASSSPLSGASPAATMAQKAAVCGGGAVASNPARSNAARYAPTCPKPLHSNHRAAHRRLASELTLRRSDSLPAPSPNRIALEAMRSLAE